MDNNAFSTNDDIIIHHIEYGPYEREIKTPELGARSNSNNLTMGYHRSSSSSSSNASSGKQLVKSLKNHYPSPTSHYPSPKNHHGSQKGRVERNYREERGSHPKSKRDSLSKTPSPDVHKMSLPKFYIGAPSSSSGSSAGSHSPERLSPEPDRSSFPNNERLKPHYLKPPDNHLMLPHDHLMNMDHLMVPELNLEIPRMLTVPDKNGKINSIYDTYWHIPRASLWCPHKNCNANEQKCSQCQLNEETASTCSSINPPPTFTAMDNYRPIRRKNKHTKCFCGAVFLATTAFSTFVLLLIAAFILYIEMVLKRTEYVPDLM